VIVHISQPVIKNKVVQMDTKPADTRQRPPISPVESFHSKNAVDKAGKAESHSK
jgi:hypothetical protein